MSIEFHFFHLEIFPKISQILIFVACFVELVTRDLTSRSWHPLDQPSDMTCSAWQPPGMPSRSQSLPGHTLDPPHGNHLDQVKEILAFTNMVRLMPPLVLIFCRARKKKIWWKRERKQKTLKCVVPTII